MVLLYVNILVNILNFFSVLICNMVDITNGNPHEPKLLGGPQF